MNLLNFQWNDDFSQDYYENGPDKNISLYSNYRWIPEISFPMACALKTLYPGCSILDFGCAKGYLVHALRLLGVEAYGFEVSRYAVSQVPEEIKPFVCTPDTLLPKVDLIFIKDTLEHIDEREVVSLLTSLRSYCDKMFIIVPFGENSRYRIDAYEKDSTHRIRRNEAWWKRQIECSRFKIEKFCYRLRGFKDRWHGCKYGNGFFMIEKADGDKW